MSLNDSDMRKSQTQKVEGKCSPSRVREKTPKHGAGPAEHRDAAEGSAMLCGSFLLTWGATKTERLLNHSSIYPQTGVSSLRELNELDK